MGNKEKLQFNEACAKHLKLNYVKEDEGIRVLNVLDGIFDYNPFEDAAQLNEMVEFMKIDVVYNCWKDPDAWSAAAQKKIACHHKKRNVAIINCIASVLMHE